MILDKKGQGLSLNVIIIAAIALIVLVVLVVIFTGRTADTDQKIEDVAGETKLQLTAMKIKYGKCQPGVTAEDTFIASFNLAESNEDEALAKSNLQNEITRCKSLSSAKDSCESGGCVWS
jgi:hypothetical protein